MDMDLTIQNDYTIEDVELLARLLYSECRGEPTEGQYAVAQCVIDRLKYGGFGKTLAGVITKPYQFAKPGKITDDLLIVASESLDGKYTELSNYSILYFRKTRDPNNNADWYAPFLFRIGNHAFYGYEQETVIVE